MPSSSQNATAPALSGARQAAQPTARQAVRRPTWHPARRPASQAVVLALVALVALAGCGSRDPDRTAGVVDPDATATGQKFDASERRSAQLAALRKPGTLVSLTCGDEGLRLQGRSARTGALVAELDLNLPDHTRPGGSINPCLPISQPNQSKQRWLRLFTPDLARMAVEITDPETNATHVGYVDLVSNQLTNLTETPASDFASTPQERAPLFDPTGKVLWFLADAAGSAGDSADGSGTSAWTIDLATRTRTERGPTEADGLVPLSGEQALDVASTYADWYLPNPAGTAVLAAPAGSASVLWLPGDVPIAEDDMGTSTLLENLPGGEELFVGDFGGYVCLPQAWLDGYRVLCKVESNYHVVTFADDFSNIVETGPPLLPETNRENERVILSPDARAIAFVSWQGDRAELFTLELRSGASPRRVGELQSAYEPIAWF